MQLHHLWVFFTDNQHRSGETKVSPRQLVRTDVVSPHNRNRVRYGVLLYTKRLYIVLVERSVALVVNAVHTERIMFFGD